MAGRKHKFEYWQPKGPGGAWYWHLKAANGEIVSQGDPSGYKRRAGVFKAIASLKRGTADAAVLEI